MMPFRLPLRRTVSALLISLVILGAAGPEAAAINLIGAIPVGYYPSWVSLNPATNLLYVTNYDADNKLGPPGTLDTVSVINLASYRVAATIPTGVNPRSIALNPATNHAYVTNQNSNTVSVIDLTTNTVLTNIPVPLPWHVTVNPTTNLAYVTLSQSSAVDVIDCTTNQIIATLPTGTTPLDVVVNPTTNLLYVTVGNPTSVYVFNGNNLAIPPIVVPVGVGVALPDREALNTQTNLLYVAVQFTGDTNGKPGDVAVIDTTTNQLVTTIPVDGVPDGIAVDQTGNRVYVGDLTTPFPLWVIDGTTNKIVSSIIPGTTPLAVSVNPLGTQVYTANAEVNTVAVINTGVLPPGAITNLYLPYVPN